MKNNNNKLLYLVWLLIIAVAVIILKYKTESTKFYGIADTREIVINSENAVEIKNVHVVPGQAITKGTLLIALDRSELTLEINNVSHQLEELRANRRVSAEGLQSQTNALKAQKEAKISEIGYQIKQLQAQYTINKELASELRSIHKNKEERKKTEIKTPIQLKIESLKEALSLSINPIRIKINMLEQALISTENPFKAQEERLEKELTLLFDEKNKLYIFAPVTGIIGSVNIKLGEKVSPFTPLLTLHSKSPFYVKGYIHENVYNRVSVGQKLTIVSLASDDKETIGNVIGIGSRIVDFPVRLRKRPDVQVWGREVQVEIPEDNNFLLGEKVLIVPLRMREQSYWARLKNSFSSLLKSHAEDIGPTTSFQERDSVISEIKVPSSLKSIEKIEASAIAYLNDIKKYLVISDDTLNKKPVLYLMDDEGTIEEEVCILGLGRINDMEAITENDDGILYVACSQSYNKKGRVPQERKLLVRIKRDRTVFRLDKKVYLFDLLEDAVRQNDRAEWAEFIASRDNTININIEGIFFYKGSLYLGFKRPLKDKKAVILKINNIERVFDENILGKRSVELWKEFELRDNASGPPMGISDLHLHNNRLFILSYAKIETQDKMIHSGNLWVYDIEADRLSLIKHLEDLKPEGITFNPDKKEFLITFDHGNEQPSRIMKLRGL